MRLTKKLAFLPVFLMMIACAYGQDVHYNYALGTNFAAYKTYEWVDLPGPGGTVPDQIIDQSIKRAVDEQLGQKGFTKVEKDGNLKVAYHAIIREEKGIDLSAFGTGV